MSTSGWGPAPPLHGHVKFVPSRRKAFSSTPPPKTETQLLFPLEAEVADTPGVALMKSNMLYRRTGTAFICSESKRLDNPAFRVPSDDAGATILMDSVIVATRRITLRSIDGPTPTRTPSSR